MRRYFMLSSFDTMPVGMAPPPHAIYQDGRWFSVVVLEQELPLAVQIMLDFQSQYEAKTGMTWRLNNVVFGDDGFIDISPYLKPASLSPDNGPETPSGA